MNQLEVRQKHSAASRIFNSLLGVSSVDGTLRLLFDILGSFSIDDGDGSENVTFKMNWRFFKLFRVYSNSVKMSKEGKFL